MPDFYALDAADPAVLHKFAGAVESTVLSLAAANVTGSAVDLVKMAEATGVTGAPTIAWFGNYAYMLVKDADALEAYIVRYDPDSSPVYDVMHTCTGVVNDTEANGVVVVFEGKIHCVWQSTNTTFTRASSADGTTFVETTITTAAVGSTASTLWGSTIFNGNLILPYQGTPTDPDGVDGGIVQLSLTSSSGSKIAGMTLSVYHACAPFKSKLYFVEITETPGAGKLFTYDGSSVIEITPTGDDWTALDSERPAIFTTGSGGTEKLNMLFSDDTTFVTSHYESSDGVAWTDITGTSVPPDFAEGRHFTVQLDLSGFAAITPEDRVVNLISGGAVDLTPNLAIHTWDGSGTWTLRIADATDVSHGVGFFQDSRPHALIVSVVDNEDGTVTITYTIHDPDSTTPLDIVAAYSLDAGATFQACTDKGTGDGISVTGAVPSGTSKTFIWDHNADSVPAESNFLVIITSKRP